MKLRILNREGNVLKLQVEGEGHTFCNVLQKALLRDKRVDLAGYNIPHPLTPIPVIFVRTKGRSNPEVALREAVMALQKDIATLRKAFEQAMKEWQS